MNSFVVPDQELAYIVNQNKSQFEYLRHANVLILGGTGFIGNWFSRALIMANHELNLQMRLVVVSRDKEKACQMFKSMNIETISLSEFMGQAFDASYKGHFSHIVFAATPTGQGIPIHMNEILGLLLRAIKLSASGKTKPSLIHLSSGAVSQDVVSGSYAVLKERIEKIVCEYNSNGLIAGSNPRIFSTYGPGLALEDKYAFGNFMLDSLSGSSITVKGNPSTTRSYIYISDLISALLALLVKPDISRIDLGGFEPISMKELAETMSAEFGGLEIIYENSNQIPTRYIPNPKYLRSVPQPISLVEGIKRWRIWAESSQT